MYRVYKFRIYKILKQQILIHKTNQKHNLKVEI